MDPDLELLQQWRDGDRIAGGKLLDRHFNGLRVFFLHHFPQEEPEDLIQEVFKRMVEARDRFEGRSTFKTYLFHIAEKLCLEQLRKKYRQGGSFDPFTESMASATGRSQSSIVAENERQQLLLDALVTIPVIEQGLIELYHFHGYTTAQLAEHFDIPHGTAKTKLQTARRRLAETFVLLFKAGGELTDELLVSELEGVREAVWRGQLRDPK